MSDFQTVLTKLLKGKKLKQPFDYNSSETNYRDDLKERFNNFFMRLDKFKSDEPIESYLRNHKVELRKVTDLILEAIDEYLSGSAGRAYMKFEELMDSPIIHNNIGKLIHDMTRYSKKDRSLYRVRYSEDDLKNRGDMFHIPFNMRNLVGTQRYSIAGLPCLYLGTSLYVCWQEMGKPDLNKLFLSRFKVENKNKVRVLNFAYSLETLKHAEKELFFLSFNGSNNQHLHKAYIVLFPLLLACSYNRAFNHGSFNVEYIIPNLLLQWISKEKSDVSGISYFSTKTTQLRHSDIGVNFVFPPKTSSVLSSGFCPELSKTFFLTKPISWQLLDTIGGREVFELDTPPSFDNVDEGFVKNYRITKFYQAEEMLSKILVTEAVHT
jgi:hypothetical protein